MTTEATPDVLGASIKRVEDPRFITGTGNYLDDIKLAVDGPHGHPAQPLRARQHPLDRHRRGQGDARRGGGLRRRRHPVQPAADGLAGRRQRRHPEQRQHAADRSPRTASSGPARASRPSSPRRPSRRYDALEAIEVDWEPLPAVVDAEKATAARRAAAPRERPEQRRVRVVGRRQGRHGRRHRRRRGRRPPAASSTSGSSRTRWRSAATSAGTTRAPTSTRSGCPARRRTSSGCC